MLHSGEIITIRKGKTALDHKIISFVSVTVDQIGADYKICESYIAECVNIKRKKCTGVVRRFIYISEDGYTIKVAATRIVSLIPYYV